MYLGCSSFFLEHFMEKQLSVVDALSHRLLKEHPSPTVSLYELGVATMQMYQIKEYAGKKIKNIRSPLPRRESIQGYRNQLMSLGILEEKKEFPADCYLLTSSPFKESTDIVCSLDPFCYISHLSAMEYHGLTDRFTTTIFMTTLPVAIWKIRVHEKIIKDLGDDLFIKYMENKFPLLTKHTISTISKNPIITFSTKSADQGAYVAPTDRPIRVSSIGRTFVDMLRKPEACGGMSHVLDVYRDNAKIYLRLILGEIEQHGEPIDKVRAGYILEELCEIKDNSIINSWVKFAQRGGSRILDQNSPFWPTFSERWCLSINVPT
jgi:hypothetical protein